MSWRPQTLYGLADSPVALAAFMIDHGDGSGQPGIVQEVLEERLERPSDLTRDEIPVGVSCFVDEIYQAPRSWAEQAYPNLVHYSRHDRGGHFASWEQPQLLSEDLRATFRSLR